MEAARAKSSPDEWGARYAKSLPHFELCTTKLRELLGDLVARAGVSTDAVEGRAKRVESFVQKVHDKGHQYEDPLVEMPDLVGLRIVIYFVDEAVKVREVIEGNFEIDWSRSSVGNPGVDPDRFGYVSDHYQVRLNPERAAFPEWEAYRDTWVEVQVRTVLQHAWAAISHKLQYKAAQEVPRELRRQLFRMSALLEVADKEFSELNAATNRLDARYAAAIEGQNLEVELNADSLAAFLNISRRHVRYAEEAVELGYAHYEVPASEVGTLAVSGFKTLVELTLEGADITDGWTLADLDRLVPDPMPESIREGLAEVLRLSIEKGFLPTAVPVDILVLAYAIALRGGFDPDQTAERTSYTSELREALREAMANVPGVEPG